MARYIFKTDTRMKEYNCEKWYILSDFIPDFYPECDSVDDALIEYVKHCDKFGVSVSNNALKCKEPMYRDCSNGDCKQVGYVITGKTLFDNNGKGWVDQYINLWTEIITVIDTEF